MRFDILTTFPEMFDATAPAALGVSIPARAHHANLVEWHAHNIRDYSKDKHHKTDDRPFGGGPGMVMMPQPLFDAVQAVEAMDTRTALRVYLSPQGKRLDQQTVEVLATKPRLLLIAGHYEGIDQRVIDKLEPIELSLGDFVLSGGELAAIILMDAIIRLLPGVLGHDQSAHQDSFGSIPTTDPNDNTIDQKTLKKLGLSADSRLLDCPHYTRPRVWEGMEVPEILLSGDHQAVARWRLEQMIKQTKKRRPDLLQ